MGRHASIERLCALAPLGEVSPAQRRRLDEHLAHCEQCRQADASCRRLVRLLLPSAAPADDEFIESRRAQIRGAVMRSIEAIDQDGGGREPLPAGRPGRSLPAPAWGALGLACLAAAFCAGACLRGVFEGRDGSRGASAPSPATFPAWRSPLAPPAGSGTMGEAQLRSDLREEERRNEAEQRRNRELAGRLSADAGRLAESAAAEDALRAQIARQEAELASARAGLDAGRAALEQARSVSTAEEETIAGLREQLSALAGKISMENAAVARERDLLAHGREIRDIIGARNLHIVDVYDTTTEGTTRRPFARAFYTEGRSLVYYAYDLPQRKIDEGNFAYVVWGQSNGSRASIRNIGILYRDDQAQQRWSLSFTDPKVLREIDSVFITLEPTGRDLLRPKGRRMLTAYLGTAPNHP